MHNTSSQTGFSMIELMIVTVIVAILAAIAIPLYFNYVVRAQSVSALSLAESFKPAANEYYNLHGTWKGVHSNSDIGMGAPRSYANDYLKSIHIVGQPRVFQIIAIYCTSAANPDCAVNKALQGNYMMLEAWVRGGPGKSGAITWYCIVDNPKLYKYVPPKCRHTAIY